MEFTSDSLARQIVAACAVSLPSGLRRLVPMMDQLDAIRRQPEIGKLCFSAPALRDCRLLVGDPNVVYRIRGGRIELLAMRRGGQREIIRPALYARERELVAGQRKLTVTVARSALLEEPIDSTNPLVLTGRPAYKLQEAVFDRVAPRVEKGSEAAEPLAFTWRGRFALGLCIPTVMLGVAVGVARDDEIGALQDRGRRELETVQSVLERIVGY